MMENYITVASFPIKVVWIAILGSALLSYGLLALKLKKEPDKKDMLDVLSNALILGWFTWKFSYAFLHPLLTIKHPLNLLYFNGGETGSVLGSIAAALYLLRSANKRDLDRGRLFYGGILGLTLFFTFYYGVHFAATVLTEDGLISLFFAILSVYLYTKGAFQLKKAVVSLLVTALFFSILTNTPLGDKKEEAPTMETAVTGLQPGNRAPDFTLETVEGEKVKLSDLKGKVVLVNLWATWCPPCRAEMPEMVRFYKDHSSKKMELLAVNLTSSDSVEDAKKFAKEYKLPFPVLLDKDGTVGDTYRTVTIPTTFVIGPDGIIKQKHVGPMSYDMMADFVKNAE
jgi:peroxiredoxin